MMEVTLNPLIFAAFIVGLVFCVVSYTVHHYRRLIREGNFTPPNRVNFTFTFASVEERDDFLRDLEAIPEGNDIDVEMMNGMVVIDTYRPWMEKRYLDKNR